MQRREEELPFRAGYVGYFEQSFCKGCSGLIAKGELRVAIMISSVMTASTGIKIPHWYHLPCFFANGRPKSVQEISHFQFLRSDDIEKIRTMIDNVTAGSSSSMGIPYVQERHIEWTYSVQSYDGQDDRTVRLKIKNGAAIDPQCQLAGITPHAEKAYVYRDPIGDVYSAVLSRTVLEDNKNSYYKLQVLGTGSQYFLFQAKGEIGAIGCMHSTKSMQLANAVEEFESIFLKETGNSWKGRGSFKQVPGKKIMLDLVYSPNFVDYIPSLLEQSVQKLLKALFAQDSEYTTNIKYVGIQSLDLKKWPLGKLSGKQIQEAYHVLAKLKSVVVKKERNDNYEKILAHSTNAYYSCVPRDFGDERPPLLDSLQAIQEETEFLNSMMSIETKYSILDAYYVDLKTAIRPLGPEDPRFEIVKMCLENTSADGSRKTLDVIEIFEVKRHGEDERYAPFKSFSNQRLLWHGSRFKNFHKILAKGLCIQTPRHGSSLFGRGIYFSDMSSKAAVYCRMPEIHDSLLLLCEVALGNMQKFDSPCTNRQLPEARYDSVKGRGRIRPDPEMNVMFEDAVQISLGFGLTRLGISLHYNEYVVYNEAQIKMRYLVQVKEHHRRH